MEIIKISEILGLELEDLDVVVALDPSSKIDKVGLLSRN